MKENFNFETQQLSYFEKLAYYCNSLHSFLLCFVYYPFLIYASTNRFLMFLTVILSSSIKRKIVFFFLKKIKYIVYFYILLPRKKKTLSGQLFGKFGEEFDLSVVLISLTWATIRIVLLSDNFSSVVYHCGIFPWVVCVNLLVATNSVQIPVISIIGQTYLNLLGYFVGIFNIEQTFTLFTISFLIFLLITQSYCSHLKVFQLLERQTLHMSAMHHEIKTPLQGIIGAVDVIRNEFQTLKSENENQIPYQLSNTLTEFLEVIRISSIYLTELIEQMMNFSRVIFFSFHIF